MSTFLIPLLVIAGAVVVLLESGKRVVRSITVLARSFKLSEYVLAYVLLAFASSLPEFSVGISAALSDVPELSFGDILGTNIINVTLVMGVVAIVGGTVSLRDYSHFQQNRLYQLIIVLAPMIMLLDGTLSRLDGVILLLLGVWSVFRLLDIDDRILGRKVLRPHLSPAVEKVVVTRRQVWWYAGMFIASTLALLAATYLIVESAKTLAEALHVSTFLIGVLVVATCTSLPELTIGVRSVLQNKGGIALGDIFGAAMISSCFTLGIVALISPIVLADTQVVWIGIIFTLGTFLAVYYFLHTKHSLSRTEGYVLVGGFVLFIVTQIVSVTGWFG